LTETTRAAAQASGPGVSSVLSLLVVVLISIIVLVGVSG
jgi:hypothetical protein